MSLRDELRALGTEGPDPWDKIELKRTMHMDNLRSMSHTVGKLVRLCVFVSSERDREKEGERERARELV